MLISEFVALLLSNSDLTKNIRAYTGYWISAVKSVPNEISIKIGNLINLLQSKIDEGLICNKNQEYLLVYGWAPGVENTIVLSTLIRPLSKIKDSKILEGYPLHIYINRDSGEVINDIKMMLDKKLMSVEELHEENMRTTQVKAPICYGNYKHFQALSCYMAIISYKPIDENDIYAGKYDNSEVIRHAHVFDSLIEARNFLLNKKELGRYILEVPIAKEKIQTLINKGLGKEIFKIINCEGNYVSITPYLEKQREFSFLNVELEHLITSGLANKAIITVIPRQSAASATPIVAATTAATGSNTAASTTPTTVTSQTVAESTIKPSMH